MDTLKSLISLNVFKREKAKKKKKNDYNNFWNNQWILTWDFFLQEEEETKILQMFYFAFTFLIIAVVLQRSLCWHCYILQTEDNNLIGNISPVWWKNRNVLDKKVVILSETKKILSKCDLNYNKAGRHSSGFHNHLSSVLWPNAVIGSLCWKP